MIGYGEVTLKASKCIVPFAADLPISIFEIKGFVKMLRFLNYMAISYRVITISTFIILEVKLRIVN